MSGAQTVQVTHQYAASAERVFDAWLDPAKAGKFLFATPTGTMLKVEIDPRVGGKFVFVDKRDEDEIEHAGEYLEIKRPRRLVFKFGMPKFFAQTTTVSIDIVAQGTECELTLTHEGVWPDWAAKTKAGWAKVLEVAAGVV